jgi:23S rRNA pseudouridine2605 synthase
MATDTGGPGPQRLQKLLSAAGVASRRGAEEIILAGRVRVNGEVADTPGAKADPETDTIEVDGRRIEPLSARRWFALNKPAGCVTTMDDPQGRPTVVGFFPSGVAGLFPVGRLDLDTEGLLLVTNDGELASCLLHPRHHVEKTYRAWVDGVPNDGNLRALREGVALDDGLTAPAKVRLVKREGRGAVVDMTIREGRKRQVRRMFSAVGHPVRRLMRTAFGPLTLEGLEPGCVRELGAEEIAALRAAAGV